MSPQLQTFIYVVLALIAGYLFGLFDKWFTAKVRKNNDAPQPAADSTPREVNRPGEQTVLKVSLDQELKWHIELDGNRLEKPEEISAEQRQRAVSVVVQMKPWLDGKTAPAAPMNNPASSTAATAMPQPAQIAPQPQQLEPVNPPAPPQNPVKRNDLKISPVRGLSSLIAKDVKSAAEKKPLSIVGMIDDVLQTRLPNTPYKDKGIRLEDGPRGEVVVVVGSQNFQDIDSVPDPEIRALIRAAITEWEKK